MACSFQYVNRMRVQCCGLCLGARLAMKRGVHDNTPLLPLHNINSNAEKVFFLLSVGRMKPRARYKEDTAVGVSTSCRSPSFFFFRPPPPPPPSRPRPHIRLSFTPFVVAVRAEPSYGGGKSCRFLIPVIFLLRSFLWDSFLFQDR